MKMNSDPKPALALLRSIVGMMISHPKDLVIDPKVFPASIEVTIQANRADTGPLIGDGAQTHKAIGGLMALVARPLGYRFLLHRLKEPVTGSEEHLAFEANPDWPRGRIVELLTSTIKAVFQKSPAPRFTLTDDESGSSGGTTRILVEVAREEHDDLVTLASRHVYRIFDCIGKLHGRVLAVDIVKERGEVESPEVQPKSASGRWAKEV